MTSNDLQVSHTGCRKPHDETSFRFRLLRAVGKYSNPYEFCHGVFYRTTGFVPNALTGVGSLSRFLYRRCMPFVCDTKTKAWHRWPEKPDDPAGLEQPVGGRNKDMPAGGYSVATGQRPCSSSLVPGETAGGYAAGLYYSWLLLCLCLCGCYPYQQPEATNNATNPVVLLQRGGADGSIRVELITVGAKTFAVASYMQHVSICEVTTQNIGKQ